MILVNYLSCHYPHFSFDPLSLDIETSKLKILGLVWNPVYGEFSYNLVSLEYDYTKRSMLSYLARVLFPLGFLTPLTFRQKVLIQQLLWSLGIGWDEPTPHNIVEYLTAFKCNFLRYAV